MRVECAEGEAHHDFARRLEVDLGEERGRVEVRLRTRPLEPDKLRLPTRRVHEVDKRFEAAIVRDFFKENHINQVFTHPYTPQENGHIESFHAILGRSIDGQYYRTLDDLNKKLERFYKTYNKKHQYNQILTRNSN